MREDTRAHKMQTEMEQMSKRRNNQELQQFLKEQMEQKRKDAEFTHSLKAVDADWISKTTNQQSKEDSYKKYMRRNMVEATQGYNQKLYLDKIEEMRAKALVDRRKFQEMAVKEAS